MNKFKLLKFLVILLVLIGCKESTSDSVSKQTFIYKDTINGYQYVITADSGLQIDEIKHHFAFPCIGDTNTELGKLQRRTMLAEVNLELCQKELNDVTEENQLFSSILGEIEFQPGGSKILQELYNRYRTD